MAGQPLRRAGLGCKDRTKPPGDVVSGERLYLSENDWAMEAVQHYFKTIERGNQQLVIDLPEGVDKAEVEVIVWPLIEEPTEPDKPSRLEIIQSFKGALKDSSYEVSKYDVYDQ